MGRYGHYEAEQKLVEKFIAGISEIRELVEPRLAEVKRPDWMEISIDKRSAEGGETAFYITSGKYRNLISVCFNTWDADFGRTASGHYEVRGSYAAHDPQAKFFRVRKTGLPPAAEVADYVIERLRLEVGFAIAKKVNDELEQASLEAMRENWDSVKRLAEFGEVGKRNADFCRFCPSPFAVPYDKADEVSAKMAEIRALLGKQPRQW